MTANGPSEYYDLLRDAHGTVTMLNTHKEQVEALRTKKEQRMWASLAQRGDARSRAEGLKSDYHDVISRAKDTLAALQAERAERAAQTESGKQWSVETRRRPLPPPARTSIGPSPQEGHETQEERNHTEDLLNTSAYPIELTEAKPDPDGVMEQYGYLAKEIDDTELPWEGFEDFRAAFRAHQLQKAEALRQNLNNRATVIQKAWHSHRMRMCLKQVREAIQIRNEEMHKQLKRLTGTLHEVEAMAATRIQRNWRLTRIKSLPQADDVMRNGLQTREWAVVFGMQKANVAAIKIQRCYRKHLFRKYEPTLEDLIKYGNTLRDLGFILRFLPYVRAAIHIQRWVRGWSARCYVRRLRLARTMRLMCMARKIQRWYRRCRGERILREHMAAWLIAHRYRAHRARRIQAITKIQSVVRMFLVRVHTRVLLAEQNERKRHVSGLQVVGGETIGSPAMSVGDYPGLCTFQWYRSLTARKFVPIPNAAHHQYTPTADDFRRTIFVLCTPINVDGVMNATQESNHVGPIELNEEMAHKVSSFLLVEKASFHVLLRQPETEIKDNGEGRPSFAGKPTVVLLGMTSTSIKIKHGEETIEGPFNDHVKIELDKEHSDYFTVTASTGEMFPLRTDSPAKRDLIAITIRSFQHRAITGNAVEIRGLSVPPSEGHLMPLATARDI